MLKGEDFAVEVDEASQAVAVAFPVADAVFPAQVAPTADHL